MADASSEEDVVRGDDGLARCRWCTGSPEYIDYHDTEWGRPVTDEVRIYEKLCLEGFQSGLSWLTILRKRDAFRTAFLGFDPYEVARFGPDEVAALVSDPSIVRHRGKIDATIANARATVALHEAGTSLASLVWSFEPPRRSQAPATPTGIASQTPESRALSKELRRRGFRFVGPTTAHAAMQSLGLVNDHLRGCSFWAACEDARRDAVAP